MAIEFYRKWRPDPMPFMLPTQSKVESDGSVTIERIEIDAQLLEALLNLHRGIHEAATNGTGYSPKVAEAMKRLKGLGVEP